MNSSRSSSPRMSPDVETIAARFAGRMGGENATSSPPLNRSPPPRGVFGGTRKSGGGRCRLGGMRGEALGRRALTVVKAGARRDVRVAHNGVLSVALIFLGMLPAASGFRACGFVTCSLPVQPGGAWPGALAHRSLRLLTGRELSRVGVGGLHMLAKGGKAKKKPGTVAENRQAKFNFQIEEKFECGIVLVGTEVKSCRAGKMQIGEGYVRVDRDGQLKLFNCNIAQHDHTGSVFNHEERRPRVLLAHRSEINQILKRQAQKGGTCVPLRVYFNDIGFLKCEIATCSGKKLKDKKDDIKAKDIGRDTKRELKSMGY